jgi:hypothetical protein
MVGPEHSLIPAVGLERRRVMQTTALAVACTEKAQWAFYEGRVRPAEKVHAPWIEHNDNQVLGGFEHLKKIASNVGPNSWLAETTRMGQADVTSAVAFTFANTVRPRLNLPTGFQTSRSSRDAAKHCRLSSRLQSRLQPRFISRFVARLGRSLDFPLSDSRCMRSRIDIPRYLLT